jgi:uncharacterized protein (TIGR02118 family)
MIVFTVMYPNGPGKHFDMDYYTTKHIGLVKEKVGHVLKGVSVEKGLSGGAPGSSATYAVVCRLQLENPEDLAAMAAYSSEFDADVPNFTDIIPIRDIREVVI